MRTLTGLSGDCVTCDQNVRKCIFAIEFFSIKRKKHRTEKIDDFNEQATLFEGLDISGRFSFN